MLFTLFASTVISTIVTDSIITGIGLGAGLYCASRTKKTSYMPKSTK